MRNIIARLAATLALCFTAPATLDAQTPADSLCLTAPDQLECLNREHSMADITLNKAYADAKRASFPNLLQLEREWIRKKDSVARSLASDSAAVLRYLIAETIARTEFLDSVVMAGATFVAGGDSGQYDPTPNQQPAVSPSSPSMERSAPDLKADRGSVTALKRNSILVYALGGALGLAAVAALVAFIRSADRSAHPRQRNVGWSDKSNIYLLCALASIFLPWVTTSVDDRSISKSGMAFVQGWICLGCCSVALLSMNIAKWRPAKVWMLLVVAFTPLLKAAEIIQNAPLIAQAGYIVQTSLGVYMTSALGFLALYTTAKDQSQLLRRTLVIASISGVALLVAVGVLVKPSVVATGEETEVPRHVQGGMQSLPDNVKREMLLQEMLNRGQITQEQFYLETTRLRAQPSRDMLNDICDNDNSAICQAQRYREQNGLNRE